MAGILSFFRVTRQRFTGKQLWSLFKAAAREFAEDKVPKLSGSLAYSTIFSIAPLLVIVIAISCIFLGQEAVQGKLYGQLEEFLGKDTAATIQSVIRNTSLSGKSYMATIIGAVTLLVSSTAVFSEIQTSINAIWGLKAKPKKGLLKMLQNRFLSFSLIISLGFVLLVSLMISSIIDEFSKRLQALYPDVALWLFYIVNQLLTLGISMLIFAVVFKVLPDARIRWRDVWPGAFFTAILFMIGKFLISVYISKSSAGSVFGPSAAVVILLIWVYYSSFILYFGAEFTKVYVARFGKGIHPNDYAVAVKEVSVESGSKVKLD